MIRNMRQAALKLLLLVCALQAGAAFADDGRRGQFAVWAIGLPNGYLVMDRQARIIQVTTDPVGRAAAKAPGNALVTIQVPPAPSADFHVAAGLIREVGIEGVAAAMDIAAPGPMAAGRASAGGGGQVLY